MSSPPPKKPRSSDTQDKVKESAAGKTKDGSSAPEQTAGKDGGQAKSTPPPPPPAPKPPPLSESPLLIGDRRQRAYVQRLEVDEQRLTLKVLITGGVVAFLALLVLILLWRIYASTAGSYAVLSDVEVSQSLADPGALTLRFDVTKPGYVRIVTASAENRTERLDRFDATGPAEVKCDVRYRPGQPTEVAVLHGRGFSRKKETFRRGTPTQADVVLVLDSAAMIGVDEQRSAERMMGLCKQIADTGMFYRVAIVGFSGSDGLPQRFAFTNEPNVLVQNAEQLRTSPPGASLWPLDTLESVLGMPWSDTPAGTSLKRVYLVTGGGPEKATAGGHSIDKIAQVYAERGIQLHIFSNRGHAKDYGKLLKPCDRFMPIDEFGTDLLYGTFIGGTDFDSREIKE